MPGCWFGWGGESFMSAGKLNVFQRLVRQWDELHPYNAAQVLQLRGTPDLDRWTNEWNRTLRELGLGRVRVYDGRFSVQQLNGVLQPIHARQITGQCELEQHITIELNQRFDPGDDLPFRPFILFERDSYYIGVVYHHWIADSASIRMLLREWFLRQFDPARARKERLNIHARGYWHN